MIDAIRSVRVATFDSLWDGQRLRRWRSNDRRGSLVGARLPAGDSRPQVTADFRKVAELAGLLVRERALHFPERSVVQMYGSKAQLLQSSLVLNMVAELRRAKTTAEFFAALPLEEEPEWSGNLQDRLMPQHAGNSYVTLLDTGVNHGHPLLAQMVADGGRHTVEPDWGPDDANGHGTELGRLGICSVIPDTDARGRKRTVRAASTGVCEDPAGTQCDNDGQSYGSITAAAVARVGRLPLRTGAAYSRWQCRPRTAAIEGALHLWSAEVDRLSLRLRGQGSNAAPVCALRWEHSGSQCLG